MAVACGRARTALYSASPSARDCSTEPPAASRPAGGDRWPKGNDGPLGQAIEREDLRTCSAPLRS